MTYKGQKQFSTACGGVLTILHMCLFVTFFTYVSLIIASYNWNITTYTLSNTFYGKGTYDSHPTLLLPTETLRYGSYVPAFKYAYLEDMTLEDVKKTVSAFYIKSNGTHESYIAAISCDTIFRPERYIEMFGSESDMVCPNITDENSLVLGTLYNLP